MSDSPDSIVAKAVMELIERIAEKKPLVNVIFELGELALRLGIDEGELMRLYVEAANLRDRERFAEVEYGERVLLLPHCLRPRDCPAKMGELGYECVKCRRCTVRELKEYAERLGYKGVFVLPGGSLVERVLAKVRPKAVVGVACYKECVMGHVALLKLGIPGQAVPLLRDGCVDTIVDVDEVKRVLRMRTSRSRGSAGEEGSGA